MSDHRHLHIRRVESAIAAMGLSAIRTMLENDLIKLQLPVQKGEAAT
jgi:hypothetical protein